MCTKESKDQAKSIEPSSTPGRLNPSLRMYVTPLRSLNRDLQNSMQDGLRSTRVVDLATEVSVSAQRPWPGAISSTALSLLTFGVMKVSMSDAFQSGYGWWQ